PCQQEDGDGRGQWLGQGDVAADQRHAQREAGIGKQATGAQAHSEWLQIGWLFFGNRSDHARSLAAPRLCLRHLAPGRAQRYQWPRARAALCRHGGGQGLAVPTGLVSGPDVGRRRGRHRRRRGLRDRSPARSLAGPNRADRARRGERVFKTRAGRGGGRQAVAMPRLRDQSRPGGGPADNWSWRLDSFSRDVNSLPHRENERWCTAQKFLNTRNYFSYCEIKQISY